MFLFFVDYHWQSFLSRQELAQLLEPEKDSFIGNDLLVPNIRMGKE